MECKTRVSDEISGMAEFTHENWENSKIIFGYYEDNGQLSLKKKNIYRADGYCIVSDASIYYKEDLLGKLENPCLDISDISDNQLILEAFKRWGEDCVKYLYGDFAFAILNENTNNLFCARDHFGCRPFFYHATQNLFAFSSNLKSLSKMPFVDCVFNEDKMLNESATQMVEKDETSYTGICRLIPAHRIAVSTSEIEVNKYWDLKICYDLEKITEEEAIIGLERNLLESVNERIRDNDSVFIELSGGLDSSSIVSIASNLLAKESKKIYAVSHVLSDSVKRHYYPFQDESSFSDIVVKNAKIEQHIKVAGENRGVYEAIQKGYDLLAGPSLAGYALMSDLLMEKVRHLNGKVLLSGLGGDEMISSKAKGYFTEIIRMKKWDVFRSEITSMRDRWWNSRMISDFIYIGLRLFPMVLTIKELLTVNKIIKYNCIYNYIPLVKKRKRKVINRANFIKQRARIFKGNVNERQINDIQHKALFNRIENSYLVSQNSGIEYRYPLLDVKLLEYYFSLPTHLKFKNGSGRYILRKTMEKYLPNEICWRKDKAGVTIPNFQYRIQKDMNQILDLIEECRQNLEYHYFDYARLLKMAKKIERRGRGKKICFGPRIFLYAIQILTLQKMQKEGKIDIGIKC